MCKLSEKSATITSEQQQQPLKLAATEEHGLSPFLIKAEADYHSSPILAWSLVILCTASFYIGPLLLLSPLLLYYFYPQAAGILFCTNLFLVFHPVSPYPPFCRYCQLFYKIFNFHHNLTPRLNEIAKDENRLSIVAMHPHAIIPLHGFIWTAICDQILPNMYGFGCTTPGALKLPVLRHLLQCMDVGSTAKKQLLFGMQTRNKNLFILPGGVSEIFLSRRRSQSGGGNSLPNTQTIKAKRYGLMKLALQTGAVIYPGFVFGASDLLDQLTPVENGNDGQSNNVSDTTTILGIVGKMAEAMSRKVKGGLTLYYGRYYLPIPYTPQLSMVLGNPIFPVVEKESNKTIIKNVHGDKYTCQRVENPTQEQVEELLGRYVNALHSLFEQYKVEAGYPNETLKII